MGNQGSDLVSFALSQLLITHSDTSSSLARRSVPLSAVGYLSLSIHNCRTYYLNPRNREYRLTGQGKDYRLRGAKVTVFTHSLNLTTKRNISDWGKRGHFKIGLTDGVAQRGFRRSSSSELTSDVIGLKVNGTAVIEFIVVISLELLHPLGDGVFCRKHYTTKAFFVLGFSI